MEYQNQSFYFNSNQLKRFILYKQVRTNKLFSVHADISNANIKYANIIKTDISNADIKYANIIKTDISNADIKYANIIKTDISDSDISYSYIHELEVKQANIDNLNVKHDITLNNNPYLPIGIVLPYATTNAPEGWLVCNGQEVSKITYASLWNVISTTFGVATDPDNNFKLPDLRGRVIVGDGTGNGLSNRNIGQTGGAETHTLTTSEIPAHNHTGTTSTDGNHTHQLNMVETDDGNFSNQPGQHPVGDANKGNGDDHFINTESAGTHNHTFTTNNTGGGQAHNIMQPFTVLNYIIKYRV
jgi:microcystin-dependent protein